MLEPWNGVTAQRWLESGRSRLFSKESITQASSRIGLMAALKPPVSMSATTGR